MCLWKDGSMTDLIKERIRLFTDTIVLFTYLSSFELLF